MMFTDILSKHMAEKSFISVAVVSGCSSSLSWHNIS